MSIPLTGIIRCPPELRVQALRTLHDQLPGDLQLRRSGKNDPCSSVAPGIGSVSVGALSFHDLVNAPAVQPDRFPHGFPRFGMDTCRQFPSLPPSSSLAATPFGNSPALLVDSNCLRISVAATVEAPCNFSAKVDFLPKADHGALTNPSEVRFGPFRRHGARALAGRPAAPCCCRSFAQGASPATSHTLFCLRV